MWKKLKELWDFWVWVENLSDEALKQLCVVKSKNYRYNVRDKKGRFVKKITLLTEIDKFSGWRSEEELKKEMKFNYFGVYRDEIF